jgi:hypothetical protein
MFIYFYVINGSNSVVMWAKGPEHQLRRFGVQILLLDLCYAVS